MQTIEYKSEHNKRTCNSFVISKRFCFENGCLDSRFISVFCFRSSDCFVAVININHCRSNFVNLSTTTKIEESRRRIVRRRCFIAGKLDSSESWTVDSDSWIKIYRYVWTNVERKERTCKLDFRADGSFWNANNSVSERSHRTWPNYEKRKTLIYIERDKTKRTSFQKKCEKLSTDSIKLFL